MTMFDNHEVSLALFVLIFLAGGLDCTTSVVFFPVARRLSNDKRYITALMLGEAMTGLLTSTLSTLQSLNDYKILSIKTFFVILSFIVIIATMSFRYIETRMMSMKENRSNVPRRRKMDEMKLFLGQAALAFVENGLHTTLLPHALASFPHSDTNISIATKLGTCTQRVCFYHFVLTTSYHRLRRCKSQYSLCTLPSDTFQDRMDICLRARIRNECVDDCIKCWCVHIEHLSLREGCNRVDCAV